MHGLARHPSPALELRVHGYAEDARGLLERAIVWYEGELRDNPTRGNRYSLGWILAYAGRWGEAMDLFRPLLDSVPDDVRYVGSVGVAAAQLGRAAEARIMDERLATWAEPYARGNDTWWRAVIAAVENDRDRAVDLLREAHQQGFPYNVWVHTNPMLDSLRGYDRFEEFITPRD